MARLLNQVWPGIKEQTGDMKTAQSIARHLINPAYTVQTRRSESIIQTPYRHILDPYFDSQYAHSTYPLNSLGSLARIASNSVEFFVNIPQLYRLFKAVCTDPSLVKEIVAWEEQGGLSAVRDVFVEALSVVGQADRRVEAQLQPERVLDLIDTTHLQSPYLRIGEQAEGQMIRKIYRAPTFEQKRFADDLFVVDASNWSETSRRTSLQENILREQFDGQEFLFVTEISEEAAIQYATSCASTLLTQLGYRVGAKTTEGEVSVAQARALSDESREFILSGLRSQGGYCFVDYLSWLMEHSEFKKCLYQSQSQFWD